jgi:hypothetical protein
MPRDPQDGRQDERLSIEWRDPRRMPPHPRDEDVRLDRRDRELFHPVRPDVGDGTHTVGDREFDDPLR